MRQLRHVPDPGRRPGTRPWPANGARSCANSSPAGSWRRSASTASSPPTPRPVPSCAGACGSSWQWTVRRTPGDVAAPLRTETPDSWALPGPHPARRRPSTPPAAMPVVDGLPVAITARQVPPRRPNPGPQEHPVQQPPGVDPLPPRVRLRPGNNGSNRAHSSSVRSCRVSEVMPIQHTAVSTAEPARHSRDTR